METEISLDDVDDKPAVLPTTSTCNSYFLVNNDDDDSEPQQTLGAKILEKSKKIFLKKPSYSKLEEIESQCGDTGTQQVSF